LVFEVLLVVVIVHLIVVSYEESNVCNLEFQLAPFYQKVSIQLVETRWQFFEVDRVAHGPQRDNYPGETTIAGVLTTLQLLQQLVEFLFVGLAQLLPQLAHFVPVFLKLFRQGLRLQKQRVEQIFLQLQLFGQFVKIDGK